MSRSTSMSAAVLVVATVGCLSGCGDSKAPSKEAFATALEPVVRDVFCHPIDVMRYELEGEPAGSGFPIVTSPKPTIAGPGSDGKAVAMLDAAAAIGFVTRTTFEKPARWSGSDNAFVRQPLISYAPTEKGAPYLHTVERKATNAMVSVPSFCMAMVSLLTPVAALSLVVASPTVAAAPSGIAWDDVRASAPVLPLRPLSMAMVMKAGAAGTGCSWSLAKDRRMRFAAADDRAVIRLADDIVRLRPAAGAGDLFPFTYDRWRVMASP